MQIQTGHTRAFASRSRLFKRLPAVWPMIIILGVISPYMLEAATAPSITTQPQSQSIVMGSNAVFSVVASGSLPLSYRWSFNGANLTNNTHIGGTTNATLTVSNVLAGDAGNYKVLVSNSRGSVTSSNATLTVLFPPTVTLQPTNEVTLLGNTAIFSANAAGTGPLTYHWQQNGTNLADGGRISGSATSTLTISGVLMTDVGSYQLVVTNAYGVAASVKVTLFVPPVVAWGDNTFFETNVPLTVTNAVAIASGQYHNLALGSDGMVTEWGDESVPAGLSNVVAIAGGDGASLALKNDSTVVAWGGNNAAQTNVPAGLSNVVAIASGGASLALRSDGTVIAWGDNSLGQTNVPAGLSNVIAIAAGQDDSLALKEDGTVVGWGENGYGEASLPAGISNVVAIAVGSVSSLALRNDGTVVAWGDYLFGQTNVPAGLSNVVAIASTAIHDMALKNDGTVVAWGDNNNGETNVPTSLQNVVAIAAGVYESMALEQNPATRVPPTIWWQGQTNLVFLTGQTAIFNPYVRGSLPMSYQWFFNGAPLSGQTNQWLALSSLQTGQSGNYSFIVSNNYGSATSAVAVLNVFVPASVTGQPVSESVVLSNTASFSVSASGTAPLGYQWYFNGTPLTDGNGITGSAAANLILSNAQANEGGSYQCIVTNNYGSDTSAVATLTMLLPPSNISVPGGIQYVASLSTAYLTVSVSGTYPMNFQWQRDGTNINNGGRYTQANATGYYGETFDIANVNASDSDTYYVVVTNQYGQATSGPVVLSVGDPPLSLDVQPINESVKLGGTAEFDAFISGTPPFTFHWQLNGVDIPADSRVSSTNESLIISPVQASDAGTYTITRVSNVYGTLIAGGFNGYLTVLLPPSITTQPQPPNQSVPAGTNITYSVSATSPNGSISYQWYFNGMGIPGAQAASMTLTNVQDTNTGSYYAILSNTGGSVTSSVVQLTVQPSAPWFINPLQSQNASIGKNVTLDPTARGSAPLSFQWEFNGTNLPGAVSATLNFASAQTNNTGTYFVIVTNNSGSATSAVATLIVQNPVQITGQPASEDALLGSNASFTVTVTGTSPNFQWYFNGAPLSDGGRITGSATAVLNISNVQSTDAGGYFVAVSNLLSSATSLTASLTPQSALGPSLRYVMLTSTNPQPPYTDWSIAATNIQDAVDAAVPGDSILVSNGLYNFGGRLFYGTNTTNRIVINKPIAVQSLNGPAVTAIAGPNTNPQLFHVGRCAYLTNGAMLSGFTLTTGGAARDGDLVHDLSGGGAWCEGTGAVISNCVITANAANFGYGGGVFGGTVINSLLATNTGAAGAGAASNSLLNCTLRKNIGQGELTAYGSAAGSGAFGSTLSNCLLVANTGNNGGGAYGSVLFNCVLTNNTGSNGGGAYSNVLYNCLLAYNVARGSGGGAYNSTLFNCTVVSNSASISGGLFGGGISGGAATNCIIYYNVTGADVENTKLLAYTCTTFAGFIGCITNAPLFVNPANGNFHLQSNSPCINSGKNAYVTVSTDLDGNPRIVGGTVDMGAYEYQTPSSVISYAYLEQYGLPIDGSADFADLNGTTFNIYQDWIAGLNPTNPASVLAMSSLVSTSMSSGITVTWKSVLNKNYFLQRRTNLATQPPFSSIQSNILGQAGTTSYKDTSATNGGSYYYRVGVQP